MTTKLISKLYIITIIILVIIATVFIILFVTTCRSCTTYDVTKCEANTNGDNDNFYYQITEHLVDPVSIHESSIILLIHNESNLDKMQLEKFSEISNKECMVLENYDDNWVKVIVENGTIDSTVVVVGQYARAKNGWLEQLMQQPQGSIINSLTWYYSSSIFSYVYEKQVNNNVIWPLSFPATIVNFPNSKVSITSARIPPTKRYIPKTIHQTWKSLDELSDGQRQNVSIIQEYNPDHAYWFWSDEASEYFIKANFDFRIWQLYNNLKPGAYKADLWRLCCLYMYGGVYLDIDLFMISPINDWFQEATDCFLVLDDIEVVGSEQTYLYNACIACVPKHVIVRDTLIHMVKTFHMISRQPSLLKNYSPLDVTGPGLCGRVYDLLKIRPRRWIRAYVHHQTQGSFDRYIRMISSDQIIFSTKYESYEEEKEHFESYYDMFHAGTWFVNLSKPFEPYIIKDLYLR